MLSAPRRFFHCGAIFEDLGSDYGGSMNRNFLAGLPLVNLGYLKISGVPHFLKCKVSYVVLFV